jgi:4-amino-4-deoxy-L-arabinose transferase-like glycosyltransferase
VLAACFIGLGVRQAWSDAPTYDEPVYLSVGVTALVEHDLRLNPEHPPLGKVLAAIPVLADQPIVPKGRAWTSVNEAAYAVSFTQVQEHAGKLHGELFLARLVPLLEAVAVAFSLYALSSRLFGRGAGLLAGALWLADPFTLGLGHLDGVDLPLTLATLLTSWALLNVLRSPGRRQLVILGVACAAAVLTKDTGVLVAFSAGMVVVVAGWRSLGWRSLLRLALVASVSWVLVWLCYVMIAPSTVLHLSVLPEPYLVGLRYIAGHDSIGAPAYLFGTFWVGGRWWYWPLSLVTKVPWLTVGVLAVGPIALRGAPRSARHEVLATAVLPAVVLTLFTLVSPKDIGLRYLLPVIGLWLVVASVAVLSARRAIVGVVLAVVVVVGGAMAVFSVPDSIAWVNPPLAPAYRTVSNSDVDWGQGFWLLRQWSVGKNPWVAYFGQGLGVADIPGARSMLTSIPGAAPRLRVDPQSLTGWVAVSATSLTSNNYKELGFLRAYCPVGELGGSILLYRFSIAPTAQAGPGAPAALCPGTYSRRLSGG